MDDAGTHPDLISLLSCAIATGEEPPYDMGDTDIDLLGVMEAQRNIGWHLLRYGFISKDWKAEQTKWGMTQDPNYAKKRVIGGQNNFRKLHGNMWRRCGITVTGPFMERMRSRPSRGGWAS